jgi:hypothetical protein
MTTRYFLATAFVLLSANALAFGMLHRQLDLAYTPEPELLPGIAGKTFSVAVKDARSYVVSGKEVPFLLGRFRGGYGNPIDVFTLKKVALAERMKRDLSAELRSLGLEESAAPARQISVQIHEFNFDGMVQARFWYDVEISVASADGRMLQTSRVKDQRIMQGNLVLGANPLMKKELPMHYAELIRELVRDNPAVLAGIQLDR